MKPLCILHTEASTGWGGQEIRILNEMLGMRRRGHRLWLATPADSAIFRRAAAAGIETFPMRMDAPYFIQGVIKVFSIMKKYGVSLVNTHSSRDSWIGSIAGRLAKTKVLRTRHISSQLNHGPLTRLVYGRLCDGIITTGEFIKGQIVRELGVDPGKITPVPTGVDVELFSKANGQRVRQELGIPPESPVIGIAAVLRSWKGHLDLLSSMRAVIDEYPEARLVLAGEGPRRSIIERTVKNLGLESHVRMAGFREDVHEVIQSFDVAVLSSYASEGIPQFVLQAMAAGKPVVGTRVGGVPEVIQDGKTGMLVPPQDPESMARALKLLLRDPQQRKCMGEQGYRRVTDFYTMDAMLDRLEELYGAMNL